MYAKLKYKLHGLITILYYIRVDTVQHKAMHFDVQMHGDEKQLVR